MKLTKEMLIDWIDRPPSNEDLDLIAKILNLQIELEVTNEIITMNINRINKLENENQQLKEIITEARKYTIIELLDDNLEWHRNNYSNITGSDLPNDSILKIVDILEKVGKIE